eukprot:CAMPEP_0185750310 /NCGR_PEP_ID=MMETSP1174-20130828/9085_1 /TAXON_ID=35687 /ORGANISM="Dictyocha speculum, Strain CCMP1381" /LENGTH=109 /DNA_ID=CAMNT_0028426821 /DNA_START=700 /DNA_END=1028 /DNA_ORIENTATION=+
MKFRPPFNQVHQLPSPGTDLSVGPDHRRVANCEGVVHHEVEREISGLCGVALVYADAVVFLNLDHWHTGATQHRDALPAAMTSPVSSGISHIADRDDHPPPSSRCKLFG